MSLDKKNKILTLGIVVLLGLIAIGVTFAFLTGRDAVNTDFRTSVSTNTVDSLMFNIDSDITITATTSNFDEGMGNQSGVANAKAILKANNRTNNATKNYYLYLDIKENELTYTTESKTAELLLQVSGPDGLVTTINGLNYVTVTDGKGEQVSGFDITEVKDLITIVNNKEITTTSEKTDNWEVKVIFVNLDTDQKDNGGKKFNARIDMQEQTKTLGEVCSGKNMAKCMKDNYTLDSHLLHHTAELANSASDNSYRYAGSYEDVENYVCFGYDGDGECPHDNLYRIIGVFGDNVKLIKADYAKASELGTGGDCYGTYKDYEEPNNYGTNKGSNTKAEIGGYYWNEEYGTNIDSNIWANSKLNKENLNGTYLSSFDSTWQSKIAMTTWKVGGNTAEKIAMTIPATVYQNEVVNPIPGTYGNNITTETKKIGLMYVSDYMYGASKNNWTRVGNSGAEDYRAAINENWMYGGLYEWTISRDSDNGYTAFSVFYDGDVGYNMVHTDGYAVRPVFYLESFVTLISGSGKESDPYKIGQPNLGETCENQNLSQCLKDNYKLDSNLLHHTFELANSAGDNSYRYAGSYESVNNYVCFGSDETTCPHDNLYRIIGVFGDQVKLIKADYAKSTLLGINGDYKSSYKEFEGTNNYGTNKGSNTKNQIGIYYWNYSSTTNSKNIWAESRLNKDNLNGTYLNSFDADWQSKIAMTTWKVGGNTYDNINKANPAKAYQYEIVNPVSGQPAVTNKIGLMYVSDYMFGASPNNWTRPGNGTDDYSNAVAENWMYNGLYEWTISRYSGNGIIAFYVSYLGSVSDNIVYDHVYAVRPVFYLESNVVKGLGTGTASDPMRLE